MVDYLAVGQKIDGGADERVILFVKLSPEAALTLEFEAKIKTEIRTRRSPRHVPARVRCSCLNAVSVYRLTCARVFLCVWYGVNMSSDYTGAGYTLYPQWKEGGSACKEGENADAMDARRLLTLESTGHRSSMVPHCPPLTQRPFQIRSVWNSIGPLGRLCELKRPEKPKLPLPL